MDKDRLVRGVELDERRARRVGVLRDRDRENAELARNLAHCRAHEAVLARFGIFAYGIVRAPTAEWIDEALLGSPVVIL